ncbi:phosphotransferase family protein [Sphingomonas sp. RS2018]
MIDADIDALTRAAVAACPDLAGLPVVVHDGGWDSIGLDFGDAWICKFPRDADGVDALRREAAVLAVVRPHLTIAVPDMAVIEGPVVFTRHRKLPGDAVLTEDYDRLSEDRRDQLAADVATFLAELHAIDADLAAIGVCDDDDDDDGEEHDIVAGLALLPAELRASAERMLAAYDALDDDPLREGLCYLDAHGRNFAFDATAGRLAGIFDFGDVGIAGRHQEFVEPAYIGRDSARRVIAAYEHATGRTVDRARVETLIGYQRLAELGGDADHPRYGALVRMLAADWFRAPTLSRGA